MVRRAEPDVGKRTIVLVLVGVLLMTGLVSVQASDDTGEGEPDEQYHATARFVGYTDPFLGVHANEPYEDLASGEVTGCRDLPEEDTVGGTCFDVDFPSDRNVTGEVSARFDSGAPAWFVLSYWGENGVRATDLRLWCGTGVVVVPHFFDEAVTALTVSIQYRNTLPFLTPCSPLVPEVPLGAIELEYRVEAEDL